MKQPHLDDEKIQQFAMDGFLADQEDAAHLLSCKLCREQADVYRLLFTALKEQPAPAFSFSLEDAVLPQLETLPGTKRSFTGWIMIAIAIPVMFAVFLSGLEFSSLVKGFSAFAAWIALAGILLLLGGLCLDMIAGYRKKIRQLDIA